MIIIILFLFLYNAIIVTIFIISIITVIIFIISIIIVIIFIISINIVTIFIISNYPQTLCVAQTLTLRMSSCRIYDRRDCRKYCVYAVFSSLGVKVFREPRF